jgi:hypothetical protein
MPEATARYPIWSASHRPVGPGAHGCNISLEDECSTHAFKFFLILIAADHVHVVPEAVKA